MYCRIFLEIFRNCKVQEKEIYNSKKTQNIIILFNNDNVYFLLESGLVHSLNNI